MSDQFRRENPHDERINVPADPHHYWRCRCILTLEELGKERRLTANLAEVTATAVEYTGKK